MHYRLFNLTFLSKEIPQLRYVIVIQRHTFQWRSQGGAEGPDPPILQTKHKHTFKLHEIGQFGQFKIITSAKEVMFLPEFVCLCVSKITEKVMEGFF